MDLSIKVDGLKELEDSLASFAPNLVRACFREAMKEAAAPQVTAAKLRAPVMRKSTKRRRAGALRDSIIANVKLYRGSVYATVGPERKPGEGRQGPGTWGLMEEFGSVHNPPQPYLRPGFDSAKHESVSRFAAVLKERIARMKSRK
jgi:HK97 gp10 family phage protein